VKTNNPFGGGSAAAERKHETGSTKHEANPKAHAQSLKLGAVCDIAV
jgi:hypothetical protein